MDFGEDSATRPLDGLTLPCVDRGQVKPDFGSHRSIVAVNFHDVALQRRHSTTPKSVDTEDAFEAELAGNVPLSVLGGTQFEAEPDYLVNNQEVVHAIILPNYEENFDTLWTTLHVLASHPRAASQYEIYLAMEQKELEAPAKAVSLVSTFETRFSHIEATFHPSGVPGEIAGKSSNVAYAAQRIINSHRRDDREDLTNKLITVIDADTHLLQDYFNEIQRLHFDDIASPELSFYTCPIIFDRNSSETPILVRCADMMWAFAGVSAMYPGSPISIPTSVYTLPLSMAERVGGWDSDAGAIGEDMHMLLKCYFAMDGNITTRVVASPVSQCNISSNEHRGWRQNMDILAARYRQALRHMWGALDTGFFIRQSAANLSRPS
ncbi:CAZyme family GT2 [Penicillium roqueforti]|nr:CAZyme family GT2 [Penicillium roqueforti]KAI3264223.1 CAZyme family GT2 [Penicillium roqueforti]KAI3283666.1 CAZyme family GT2 [Penicillium roqueforti]